MWSSPVVLFVSGKVDGNYMERIRYFQGGEGRLLEPATPTGTHSSGTISSNAAKMGFSIVGSVVGDARIVVFAVQIRDSKQRNWCNFMGTGIY